MDRNRRRQLLALPYVAWSILFTLIPLFVILRYAMVDKEGHFTVSYIFAFLSSVNAKAFLISLEIAVICTVICVLLAYPLVMVVRRLKISRMSFMLFFLIMPMWMNFILRILAMQMIISNNGIINHILETMGLAPLKLINTPGAIILGMVYDYLPYMMLPVLNSILSIPEDVIEAAQDLGAGRATVFAKVILPLSMPGLLSGITMVFVPSMTSFVVADILGGGKFMLVGNLIREQLLSARNWPFAAAISVVLMLATILFIWLYRRITHVEELEGLL